MSIDDLIGEDDDDGNGDGLGSTFYQTPIDTQTIVVNPKVDGGPVDLRCPHCDEVIEAVSGEHVVEYRCGCDELRKFRIRGSDA